MSDETKLENANSHGSYERQDLSPAGILYFLLGLAVATLLCVFALRGLFVFLENREKASQPQVSPLVTNLPADTRRIPGDPEEYLKKAFPDPRLENDESKNFSKQRLNEEQVLYSYGWIDEKAGTLRIPIERAMDLLEQRGLPVRSQGAVRENAAAKMESSRKQATKSEAVKKDKK